MTESGDEATEEMRGCVGSEVVAPVLALVSGAGAPPTASRSWRTPTCSSCSSAASEMNLRPWRGGMSTQLALKRAQVLSVQTAP